MAGEQARSSIQSKEDMRLSFTIRTDSPLFSMPRTVAKPYDWTYTTTYAGHSEGASSSEVAWKEEDLENTAHGIPIAELTRPDPILFYAEIPLFEDELHDNGASHLLVRIVSTSFSLLPAI